MVVSDRLHCTIPQDLSQVRLPQRQVDTAAFKRTGNSWCKEAADDMSHVIGNIKSEMRWKTCLWNCLTEISYIETLGIILISAVNSKGPDQTS